MIRYERSPDVVEHSTPTGTMIRLTADSWRVLVTLPIGGVAFARVRPRSVESERAWVPIRDYTWTVQMLALAAPLVALLIRRFVR